MPDTICPRPVDSQWLLQAHPSDAARIAEATALELGGAMLRTATTDGWQVLHLAPDEWLLTATATAPDADLRPAFARVEAAYSLVDVSDRTVGRLLVGPAARDLLAGACSLDLDSVPVGYCSRTLFGKITALVWRLTATTWRVDVARSYEGYLDTLLAANEAGLPLNA